MQRASAAGSDSGPLGAVRAGSPNAGAEPFAEAAGAKLAAGAAAEVAAAAAGAGAAAADEPPSTGARSAGNWFAASGAAPLTTPITCDRMSAAV